MTSSELAKSYLEKAHARRRVLEVLMEQGAFSDVVREGQELVELALKGLLRAIGIDPPKWHDVGPIVIDHADKLPAGLQSHIKKMAEISRWLRKEREFAFYGDIDLIPTEEYTEADAKKAMRDAFYVLERVRSELKI